MGAGSGSGGRLVSSGSNSGSGSVITGGAMYEKYLHGTSGRDCKEEVEVEIEIEEWMEGREEVEVGSV